MKFLIIRFSSIGDIVLTTPVIRCIKTQVEGAEVHFLTKEQYQPVLAANPYIDRLHLLQEDADLQAESLRQEQFDYVIDLHKNLRTAKIKRALKKVPSFAYNKLNFEKWLYTSLKIDTLPAVHIVDRYMDTVVKLGVVNDGKGLDYFVPGGEKVAESDIPMSHLSGYIGLVIGASYATKKLTAEQLQELCLLINHPIVLLGGPEDRTVGDLVATVDPVKVYNACGKFTLNESADLVRRSKLMISHDTGLMHIAAAYKKPVISVWGNTVPKFGMYPYYGVAKVRNEIFEVLHLGCRPCSKLGYRKCPRGHFKCMKKISMPALAEAAEKMLR